VQQQLRDRFVQDGNGFYFRDGRLAFYDQDRRLSMAGENLEVIVTLIEIARARGWQEVTVEGTHRFRRHAWRRGRLAGLVVRGYTPSPTEHAALIRAISGDDEPSAPRGNPSNASVPPGQPLAMEGETGTLCSQAAKSTDKLFVGRLLAHGLAPYRSRIRKRMSYFARIEANEGPRTIWAKDLQRAMEQSRSQPRVGDQITVGRVPSHGLPVKFPNSDAEEPTENRPNSLTRRQGWVIEKRDFFEARSKAAETFRNPAIDPRDGVRQHPELVGSYLNVRKAELAARGLRDPADQKRFVEMVRNRLADNIARGDPFPVVRLRIRPEGEVDGNPNLERGHPPVR
jgi:hypothetical protein